MGKHRIQGMVDFENIAFLEQLQKEYKKKGYGSISWSISFALDLARETYQAKNIVINPCNHIVRALNNYSNQDIPNAEKLKNICIEWLEQRRQIEDLQEENAVNRQNYLTQRQKALKLEEEVHRIEKEYKYSLNQLINNK